MKMILIALSFSFSLLSAGQVRIINESLTDSTVNYFYIGVDNKISISGIPSSHNKFSISILNGTVTKVAANQYIVPVNSPTDSCKLSIGVAGKVIFTRYYKVRTLPPPVVFLGALKNPGTATIEEILADTKLRVELPGCYYKHNLKVATYYISISTEQSETVHLKPTPGDRLTSWERNRIVRCVPPAAIVVSNFTLNNKINGNHIIPSIIIIVKE